METQPSDALISALPQAFFDDLAVGEFTFAHICEHYGLSTELVALADDHPEVHRRVREAQRRLDAESPHSAVDAGMARMLDREILLTLVARLRDPDIPASVLLDGSKYLHQRRYPKHLVDADTGGARFTIQFNMPAMPGVPAAAPAEKDVTPPTPLSVTPLGETPEYVRRFNAALEYTQ